MKEVEVFYPKDVVAWRKWLDKNHACVQSVWLVFHNKKSAKKSITWSESVDVALCYGWIDSKKVKIDEHTSHQFFSKRKAKSTWSKINKEKTERLIAEGLMTKAGLDSIEVAKQNGSWSILDEVEELIIPTDLEKAFKTKRGSKEYFTALSKSSKKMLLYWIKSARRPETRQKRIDEIVQNAAKGRKPAQF